MTRAEYKKKWAAEHPENRKRAMRKYLYNGNRCLDCGKLIERRSKRCNPCAKKGSKSHFWKGGVYKLSKWIRKTLASEEWSKGVLKRDNYVCQVCFKTTGYKHAHHKYHFKDILKDFLQEYNQFSPIDDTEILVRLAERHQPFWSLDNGITLCPDCHKRGAHQWITK